MRQALLTPIIAAAYTFSTAGGGAGPQGPAGTTGLTGATGASSEIVRTTSAATAIGNNKLVYVLTDGQIGLASSIAEGTEAIGYVKVGGIQGAQVTYQSGVSLWTGLTGLIPGASYYMGTAGNFIDAASADALVVGNVLLAIGKALDATSLLFQPVLPITL